MYRDLYSAIMCRPLLSAERQGENEEELAFALDSIHC